MVIQALKMYPEDKKTKNRLVSSITANIKQIQPASILKKLAPKRVWKELRKNRQFLLIDLALIFTSFLLFITAEKNLIFLLICVLLVYGAFFWSLLAFIYRAVFWIPISILAIVLAVFQGDIKQSDLIYIPIFSFVLLMVFAIARRRTTAEKSLRDNEQQYRRLVELTFESIIILVDGEFVFVNAQAVSLFKANSEAELKGESISKYLHPASFEGFQVWARHVIDENNELPLFEDQFVRPDNSFVDVEAAGLVIAYQDQPALLLIIRDVTARKQAEKAVRDSYVKYQELLESAPDAIVVSDKEGSIRLINAQTEEMFGYSRDELVGESIQRLLPPQLHDLHLQQNGRYTNTPTFHPLDTEFDLLGRHKDGSELPIDVKVSRFFIEDGLRITTIIRDITERKQAEEQVIRAAHLAALGKMSTALTHELNNPLQIIKGYLDIVLDFPTEWEEAYGYLQIIRQQVNRMHKDTQNILNYARPAQKSGQLVCVVDLVRQVLELAHKPLQQLGFQVVEDFDELPLIWADPDSLTQVFLNIVINAVESANKTGNMLQIALKAKADQVEISFVTNGSTIPDKDLPYIFDPFFTTKSNGNGLGLWISRNLVKQYQGSIYAQNMDGNQGVMFTVSFPQTQRKPEVET